jgi:hypothetical protein
MCSSWLMPCNRNVAPKAPIDRQPTQGSHRGRHEIEHGECCEETPDPTHKMQHDFGAAADNELKQQGDRNGQ